MTMDWTYLLTGILIMAGITFLTRLFPFVAFSQHKPGPRFKALQDRLPALILVVLVLWAIKGTPWNNPIEVAATLGCLGITVALHVWKRNALISIFVPTIIFMIVRALT